MTRLYGRKEQSAKCRPGSRRMSSLWRAMPWPADRKQPERRRRACGPELRRSVQRRSPRCTRSDGPRTSQSWSPACGRRGCPNRADGHAPSPPVCMAAPVRRCLFFASLWGARPGTGPILKPFLFFQQSGDGRRGHPIFRLMAMKPEAWLRVTPEGLCCVPGGFHIDPVQPIERAVVTHGHSDHARPGHRHVLATPETIAIMRRRLGEEGETSYQSIGYGEVVRLGDVTLRLVPAGHVLG